MKKKILIVDDDLDMLNLYQAVLREDFDAIPATNGKEAVERAVAEVPDLILMDITEISLDDVGRKMELFAREVLPLVTKA